MSYFLLGPLGWKLQCLWLRGFLRVLQGLDAGGGGSTAAVLCTPGWGSSCFRSDVMYWISAMAAKDQVYPFSGKSGGFERVHKLGIYIYIILYWFIPEIQQDLTRLVVQVNSVDRHEQKQLAVADSNISPLSQTGPHLQKGCCSSPAWWLCYCEDAQPSA